MLINCFRWKRRKKKPTNKITAPCYIINIHAKCNCKGVCGMKPHNLDIQTLWWMFQSTWTSRSFAAIWYIQNEMAVSFYCASCSNTIFIPFHSLYILLWIFGLKSKLESHFKLGISIWCQTFDTNHLVDFCYCWIFVSIETELCFSNCKYCIGFGNIHQTFRFILFTQIVFEDAASDSNSNFCM